MKRLLLGLLLLATASAQAANVRLRETALVGGGLVRLGDVAQVIGRDAEALAATPLMPAPTGDGTRWLSCGAIRDMLQAQGIDPKAHRFGGAFHVRVSVGDTPAVAPTPTTLPTTTLPKPNVPPTTVRPATPLAAPPAAARPTPRSSTAFRVRPALDRVDGSRPARRVVASPRAIEQALVERLQEVLDLSITDPNGPRLLVRGVEVSNTAAKELGAFGTDSLRAQFIGGQSPDAGSLSALAWPASRGPDEGLRVVADVVRQPMRVVATQPLPRGATVVRSAVRLERVPLNEIDRPNAVGYGSLDQAVGKETLRAIRAGDALSAANSAPPTVVHKGEEVEVFAGGGGVSVRLAAIAKADGRMGDLVEVEAYDGREAFNARVVGVRRLAVLSAGSSAGGVVRSGGIQ